MMRRFVGLCSVALSLGACGNPYGLNLNEVNLDAEQRPGVIQFTDPKLYKREALINERKNELAYLDTLHKETEKPEFNIKPEIARELEVIQAFSAALGLKFEPAAAANFQRDTELADLKHQMELTKLDMQLAQLRRDAELQKAQLAQQTQPSGTQPPAGGANTVTPPTLTPPDVGQLIKDIEALRAKLETRLTATPAATPSAVAAGPIDKFNDVAAYRNVLKSAINAVSLDELHDKDGNSLFRVQLKSTVLPGAKDYRDTLGILRMEIGAPNLTAPAMRDLYLEWLLHVNRNLNLLPDTRLPLAERRMRTTPGLLTIGDVGELYVVTLLEVPKGIQPPERGPDPCAGVHVTERWPDRCWYVRIAAPILPQDRLNFAAALERVTLAPRSFTDFLLGARSSVIRKEDYQLQWLPPETFKLDDTCTGFVPVPGAQPRLFRPDPTPTDPSQAPQRDRQQPPRPDQRPAVRPAGLQPNEALVLARSIREWWPYLSAVLGFLSELDFSEAGFDQPDGTDRTIARHLTQSLDAIRPLRDAAGAFLLAVTAENPRCATRLMTADSITVPERFTKEVSEIALKSRVTVYDVAPTERAQQVSTMTRAADAIALAAAVAGQLPSYDLGTSGNFAYSRTATGKADAIERAPLVVGFAEPGQEGDNKPRHPAFGWLLGPQVSVDPTNKALVLTQRVKPYDLYADISLPGWWPYFTLKTYTSWAPDWRTAEHGASAHKKEKMALGREVKVPMEHNAADMDGLTALLLDKLTGQHIAYPSIVSIEPRRISACSGDVQFQIRGANIWRASLVHVGGLSVQDKDINLLPDMRGVLVKIKASDIPRTEPKETLVSVWTKDGHATFPVVFENRVKADKTCELDRPQPQPTRGPNISSIAPATISVCDNEAVLTVQGRELQGASSAVLGTMRGSVTELAPRNGTALEVRITGISGKTKIGTALQALTLAIRTPRGVVTSEVKVAQQNAC